MRKTIGLLIFIILVIIRLHQAEPLDFKRSIVDSSDALMFRIRSFCDVYDDLTRPQREICHNQLQLIASVADGAEMARKQCAKQFKNEKWNCTITGTTRLLGLMKNQANKEAAFYYALVCAGIVHFMARDCMKGILEECHCSQAKRPNALPSSHSWGGCGDNVEFATAFSKKFLDDPLLYNLNEKTNPKVAAKVLMDAHNNEAGRQAVIKHRIVVCKCHGVTATCVTQTCWYQVKDFGSIGDYLKKKYSKAIKAKLVKRRKGKKLALKFKTNEKILSRKDELVYVEESPNYCRKNIRNYSMGTSGRQCNTTLTGTGSCQALCCGRRFKTERKVIQERCDCTFVWCCEVKCKTCTRVADIHTCL